MHSNASPGLDGFGPSFFKATWSLTSSCVVDLFHAFHTHAADLERINRSYLVLLPKKNNAREARDFRPIALQNTTIKCLSKVLTHRLQPSIPLLVSNDQAGFVLGRCIAESFAYAADLLHCCHRRNAPTLILKLDFHKAFDCVNWDSLNWILRCRGFPDNWCSWVSALLDTGKTSVLLNGVPGRWINCLNGLRQGDPLSPYHFIIVAGVLRRLLHHPSFSSSLSHPLISDAPCPVLQYAEHLSGWSASLLNRAGRLTLSSSVLSSIPLHYMSAMSIPKTTIQAIDRRRGPSSGRAKISATGLSVWLPGIVCARIRWMVAWVSRILNCRTTAY